MSIQSDVQETNPGLFSRGRKGLRISTKLPVIIVTAAVILAAGIGIADYRNASSTVDEQIAARLSAVAEGRKAALGDYLASIDQDMRFIATNPTTIKAVQDFTAAWRVLGEDQTATLQQLYIEENPHPLGQKENLDFATDGSLYSEKHATYHPWFRQFLRERGYYDVFLFDMEGDLVYTVFKELDYATNLASGEYKDTDLGNAYRAAAKGGDSLNFFDFKPYAPSHGAPASFISTAIMDQGKQIGVLVFQMPIDNINRVMGLEAGLGETGESYILGGDFLMRNDTRFASESTILSQAVENDLIRNSLAAGNNEIANGSFQSYRGTKVQAFVTPFKFHDTKWVLVAEIAQSEIDQPINAMRNLMLMISGVLLLAVAAGGIFFSRGISRPLAELNGVMSKLSTGDTTVEVTGAQRSDEIGDMARTVQIFKDSAIEMERMHADQAAREVQAQEEKRQTMLKMADDLESSVGGIIAVVSSAATKMQSTAQSMTATSEETSTQAAAVAAASEKASNNVDTVASATEELSSSVSEISRQVTNSAAITSRAVEEANTTTSTVQGMSEAAQKIGEVVNLISDIAEQTNLLALNATIEAARAGEAGKGFAVVASEVKNLATQTAKATENISAQITDMQTTTGDTVKAIEAISKTIEEVNGIASGIASAVEEQGAATQEIARNLQEAAKSTQEVSSNISGVTQAAGETGAVASQVLGAAGELASQAEALRTEVDRFLAGVRAA